MIDLPYLRIARVVKGLSGESAAVFIGHNDAVRIAMDPPPGLLGTDIFKNLEEGRIKCGGVPVFLDPALENGIIEVVMGPEGVKKRKAQINGRH